MILFYKSAGVTRLNNYHLAPFVRVRLKDLVVLQSLLLQNRLRLWLLHHYLSWNSFNDLLLNHRKLLSKHLRANNFLFRNGIGRLNDSPDLPVDVMKWLWLDEFLPFKSLRCQLICPLDGALHPLLLGETAVVLLSGIDKVLLVRVLKQLLVLLSFLGLSTVE